MATERELDERSKAEVTVDVTAIVTPHQEKVSETIVKDKEAGKARIVMVKLTNGRNISIDCVDNWQAALEKQILKFKDKD